CARRQLAASTASAFGKLAHICRDIHHQPMPEARASRRVGIVAGDGKALCARWRPRPFEMRRPISAGATKAEIGRKNKIIRQIIEHVHGVVLVTDNAIIDRREPSKCWVKAESNHSCTRRWFASPNV